MKIFKIEENDANQRLDKFLKKLFPNATRSLIYKLNRKDKIKVLSENDLEKKFRKKDNEYKLELNDEVKIFLKDEEFKELSEEKKENPFLLWEKFDKKDIIFEDSDLFVVNKSAGINVHPWDHKTKETNLIAQVQDYLWEKLNSLTFKPSLIHRIDRDTSGILMIAKKKNILTKLVSDFKEHKKLEKTYYAIVLGRLSRKEGTIKKSLKRIENAKWENKVQVANDGQTAITHFKLLKEYFLKTEKEEIILSEVEVKIETGRMHQIRVHMASIWNPIVWDKTYWDKQKNTFFEKNFWFKRQALHAWKIKFFHYGRKKKMELEARIKEDLVKFLQNIEKKNN